MLSLLFVGYLECSFVVVFFNCALIHATLDVLDGKAPSLTATIEQTADRWMTTLAWSSLAATVCIALSLLRSALESRLRGHEVLF
ncbi:MAG: hypothetical protein AAGJ70_10995 [Pseudomonadota bacterium]